MKRRLSRIATWSLLAAGFMFGGAGRATAQNNSLFAAEQQQASEGAPGTPGPAESAQPATPPTPTTRAGAHPAAATGRPAAGAASGTTYPVSAAQGPQVSRSLADVSWTYQAPTDIKKIVQINDIVKVTVSVKSQMTSQGSIDRKKLGHGDLKLTSWIKFYGGNLGEDGGANGQSPYGTPEIRGDIDNQMQANGNLQTADKLSFVISCRIVDKRPNGNCVVEGTWSVSNNEEHWEYSLSGEVRPEDIKPDNSVVSDTIADLKVIKRESGNVRDSYRRGSILEFLDKWSLF